MRIIVAPVLLSLCTSCLAQPDSADKCPPALYIQAGNSQEFASPNANATCPKALVSYLATGTNETVQVKQDSGVCDAYPIIHITIPDNTPVGTAKITWLCENEQPNPCQLMIVQPASASGSTTASEVDMSMECPSIESAALFSVETTSPSHPTSFTPDDQGLSSIMTGGGLASESRTYLSAATGSAVDADTLRGTEEVLPTGSEAALKTDGDDQNDPTETAYQSPDSGSDETPRVDSELPHATDPVQQTATTGSDQSRGNPLETPLPNNAPNSADEYSTIASAPSHCTCPAQGPQ